MTKAQNTRNSRERPATIDLPRTGKMEGAIHRYPVRVYYEDTDFTGVVYHANYLKFIERARSETLRLFPNFARDGQDGIMARDGLFFAVKDCFLNFHKPARMDDLLEVRTSLHCLKGASLAFLQEIYKEEKLLVSAKVRIVMVAAHRGVPARIPKNLRQEFERLWR